ncbi:hypothetical protein Are01nite_01750 [Actinoplanes regularis]|nr:hypothetical protein Are01nite_01750 [Actinoplanes regularis]
MTAAGLAFIAGGLATLISFRAVLFGGGDAGEQRSRGASAPGRRRPVEPVHTPPELELRQEDEAAGADEPGRGRRLAAALSGRSVRAARGAGLASIGLADEDEYGGGPRQEHAVPARHDDAVPARYDAVPARHDDAAWSGEQQGETSWHRDAAWPGEQRAGTSWHGDGVRPGEQQGETSWRDDGAAGHAPHSWYENQAIVEEEHNTPEGGRGYDYPRDPGYDDHRPEVAPAHARTDSPLGDPSGEDSRYIDNTAWRAGPPPSQETAEPGWTVAGDDQPVDERYVRFSGSPRPAPIDRSARAYSDPIDRSAHAYSDPIDRSVHVYSDPIDRSAHAYSDPIDRSARAHGDRADRSTRPHGDRIDGWVRPHYRDLDDRPAAGDYWTPVPDELYADPEPSARGYGWPILVERLPAVPDYGPVTGFDLTPVQAAEPTTLMPAWQPRVPDHDHQIRLPRTWAARDEQGRGHAHLGEVGAEPSWNRSTGRSHHAADLEPPHDRGPRPRPRPRPAPAAEPDSSYISRHSAGPYG